MKDNWQRVIWLTVALSLVAAVTAVAATQAKKPIVFKSGLVEKIGNGEIDWGKEMFYAQGQGAMPTAAEEPSRSRAFLKAKDYAKLDAISNMRMLISGCTISYEATGKDYMVEDATLRQTIDGYVKNVQVLKVDKVKEGKDTVVIVTVGCRMYGNETPGGALLQKISELNFDGSWAKSAEVTEKSEKCELAEKPSKPVKIDIPGKPMKTVEVSPEPPKPVEEKPAEVKPIETKSVEETPAKSIEVKVVEKAAETKPVEATIEKPNPPAVVKATKPFTGVIIDTLGLHIYRAMSPKIRKQSGVEVWGTLKMDPDEVQDHGPVAYTRTIAEAKKCPRSGGNPLVLKAIGRAGGMRMCDVVIDDEAATKLKQADQSSDPSFLMKMNVVVVVDPVQIQ